MTKENARSVYADIIDLPHHQSSARKHMSLYDRAAQFASYKALSGYEEMVAVESRAVDGEIELSENEIDIINAMIGEISDRIANGELPTVSITYFKPDCHKKGESYDKLTGIIKKIDAIEKKLIFYGSDNIDDKRIPTITIPIKRVMSIIIQHYT